MVAAADPSPPQGLFIHLQHPTRRINTERLRRLLEHTLAEEGERAGYLSIVLADHATVHKLNREYLAHDYITDVLAFPMEEARAKRISGEIYVDLDTAAERHTEFDASYEKEACRYAVHGLLHLLGYDDKRSDAREVMQKKEDRYLDVFL